MSDLKKQDLKQQPSARLKNTQEQSLESIGLTRQSIEIFDNSPQNNCEQMDLFQTLSVEGIHASHFQSQENNSQREMKDISFQRCLDLFETSGQDGAFSRMLADTLNSVMTKLPHHWKVKVTPSGRILFQLAPLMPRTKETDSGLWRTPETSQGGTVSEEVLEQMAEGNMKRSSGHQRQLRLQDQVRHPKLWPTPMASDDRDRGNLSSPSVQRRQRIGKQVSLSQCVSETSGQLNPMWVEWLMGYPTGHTELSASETQSFLKSRKSSGKQ